MCSMQCYMAGEYATVPRAPFKKSATVPHAPPNFWHDELLRWAPMYGVEILNSKHYRLGKYLSSSIRLTVSRTRTLKSER